MDVTLSAETGMMDRLLSSGRSHPSQVLWDAMCSTGLSWSRRIVGLPFCLKEAVKPEASLQFSLPATSLNRTESMEASPLRHVDCQAAWTSCSYKPFKGFDLNEIWPLAILVSSDSERGRPFRRGVPELHSSSAASISRVSSFPNSQRTVMKHTASAFNPPNHRRHR